MEVYAMRMGLLKSTLPGRESGLDLSGVTAEGIPYTRTVPVDQLRIYYDNNKNYSELFLHDGSFVKLRQVILSYKIPVRNFKLFKIQSASISFVGRNLAILYRKTKNFDPEHLPARSEPQSLSRFADAPPFAVSTHRTAAVAPQCVGREGAQTPRREAPC